MQGGEQSHLKCQLISPLDALSAGRQFGKCSCLRCGRCSRESHHRARGLLACRGFYRMGPSSKDFVGVTEDFPWALCYVPSSASKQVSPTLSPAESWGDCWFIYSFCYNERVLSLCIHVHNFHLLSWGWWPTEDRKALFLFATCQIPL